jgi:hypothetical protein
MLNKKIIDDVLKNIKGDVRGVVFKTDAEFVKEKIGEKGIEKLQDAADQMGIPIDYKGGFNATRWYPLSWRVLSILLIQEVFDWNDEKIIEMGSAAPKYSFMIRTLLRYFLSLEKTFSEISKYWTEHYSVGELVVPDPTVINENYLLFYLKDFKVHPIMCEYYKGYFLAVCKLIIKADNMSIVETKCMFKGDDYHEFKVIW